MSFHQLPAAAAWRHGDGRDGFEAVFFTSDRSGHRLEGHTVAVDDGTAWTVHYEISLDAAWLTEQRSRVADDGNASQYDYRAPAFDFDVRLVYDGAGLLLDYPGITRRVP